MHKRFKRVLKKAQKGNHDTFMFDGNEYVVAYAGYLDQYLDYRFGKAVDKP